MDIQSWVGKIIGEDLEAGNEEESSILLNKI